MRNHKSIIGAIAAEIMSTMQLPVDLPDSLEIARRHVNSMSYFADGDDTINLGQWKRWREVCHEEGRTIPPAEFKARPVRV